MIAILLAFGLAIVVGVAANTRGRSGFGWFLLSLIVTPIITGLLVIALPYKERSDGPIRITPEYCYDPAPQSSVLVGMVGCCLFAATLVAAMLIYRFMLTGGL